MVAPAVEHSQNMGDGKDSIRVRVRGGGSSSTYPYIHITINILQVELKNAWGATDLVIMKCVCSSARITNTCHTTEESQAIVVTSPKVHLD